MKIEFDASDYTLLNSEEDLLIYYPPEKWGHYRPQPWSTPEKYPCLMKELATIDNPNGADHAVLTYIYDFETKGE